MKLDSPFPFEKAICYSGFRDGQSPGQGLFPLYDEVKADLTLLQEDWKYLRLYDCDQHAQTVLEVIRTEGMDFKVLLGAYIIGEENNPNCPWNPPHLSKEELLRNRDINDNRIELLIQMAQDYADIVNAVSIGNEASVSWTDHMVSVNRLIAMAQAVKRNLEQPVTFCENYVPWLTKLEPLVAELDFISIHTYPVWEYKTIDEALSYTQKNYNDVAEKYPNKPVVISEAGWATKSNGRGIDPSNVSESLQKRYFEELSEWTEKSKIITYVFEAFDENWKGSNEPLEPEKHWGLYKVDRSPKLVVK